MAPSSDDRRKRIRVPVQQKIRHSRYQVLGTPIFEENSAVDLSSNGISFQTEQEYKKCALVLLEVVIDEQLLKLLVCVAWVKRGADGKYTVGAELIAIDPEHKKQMQGHLSSLIQKFSAKTKKKPAKKKKVAKKKPVKKAKKKSAKKKSVAKKKKRSRK